MTVGHLSFAWLFIQNLRHKGAARRSPTVFGSLDTYLNSIGGKPRTAAARTAAENG
jgi:hypothetical protein